MCFTRPRYQVSVCRTIGPLVYCVVVLGFLHPISSLGHTQTGPWVKVSSERLEKPGIESITVITCTCIRTIFMIRMNKSNQFLCLFFVLKSCTFAQSLLVMIFSFIHLSCCKSFLSLLFFTLFTEICREVSDGALVRPTAGVREQLYTYC